MQAVKLSNFYIQIIFLQKKLVQHDLRKFFLPTVEQSAYNGVVYVKTTDVFQTKLDKFWSNQE